MLKWLFSLLFGQGNTFKTGQVVTLAFAFEYIPEGAVGEIIDYADEENVRVFFDLREYRIVIPNWPDTFVTEIISAIPEEYLEAA